nr:ribonuclease H-like domain-containing protein [Tanacetum cinerariifolium]
MKDKFQMSLMEELTFFLGLQVKQKKDGIFISQDKYVAKILKKFGLSEGKSASTLIDAEKPLLKDSDGEDVDVHTYRVFNSLMLHMLRVEMVINSPWMLSKNWLVQKQTAFSKDTSNPFMADNLAKIVWFLTHRVTYMKSWLVQKQTVIGKDASNPLIVDSLLKTIWFSIHHHLTIEVLAIPGQTGVCDEIRTTAARLSSYCCQANKSDAAEGFAQIIDFLSGSYIHYALTMNPYIYISCIKQFWNTFAVKRSGEVTRLQALVDKKKIVISEAVIREILQLNDAEGVNQVGDLSTHTTCFISPALTQKVFTNMRRVGKGFLRVETPLFEGMLVVGHPAEEGLVAKQVQVDDATAAAVEENVVHDVSHDAIPSPPPHAIPSPSQEPSSPPQQQQSSPQAPPQDAEFQTQLQQVLNEKANKLKSSKLRRLRTVGASRRVESSDDMEDVFNQGRMIADMDMNERIELVKDTEGSESEGRHAKKQAEIYNLDLDHSLKVLISAASITIHAASATIPAAKPTIPADVPTVVETPKVKDKGKGILVETPKPINKKDQIKMDDEHAKKLQEEINKDYEKFSKDIDWDAAMDYNIAGYQGMKKRPQTKCVNAADEELTVAKHKLMLVETLLFKGMLAVGQPAKEELADEQVQVDNAVAAAVDENVGHAEKHAEIYNLDLEHSSKVLSMQEDDSEVQEVVEVVTTAKL